MTTLAIMPMGPIDRSTARSAGDRTQLSGQRGAGSQTVVEPFARRTTDPASME